MHHSAHYNSSRIRARMHASAPRTLARGKLFAQLFSFHIAYNRISFKSALLSHGSERSEHARIELELKEEK